MSDKLINLKVITPVEVLFEGEAKSFIVKTRGETGEFAVLADHIPMTAAVGNGTLVINLPDETVKRTTLFTGYCVVHNNNAVIIVEAGEKPEEIDV
jgi:F0F1-type ATP synthase epsilon subunit